MKVPANTKLYETPISTFWIDEDGIICGISKKTERTLEHYKQVMDVYKSILKPGEKRCLLADASEAMPLDKTIRDYLASEMPKYIKAQAIISATPLDTTLNSTFLKVSFLGFPVRIFTNKEEGKDWLKLYL